jgi:hypothetical protein
VTSHRLALQLKGYTIELSGRGGEYTACGVYIDLLKVGTGEDKIEKVRARNRD